MMTQDIQSPPLRLWAGPLLLFFLIIIIYSNTLNASWHFDDHPKIVQNPKLQIQNLHPETLFQTFFSAPDDGSYLKKRIYRPIPSLTFAINWYVGQYNVFGYHLVNICVHFLTACFLFLAVRSLFNSPLLRDKYPESEYFIALLTASLWALNPIQTQAITYIVQRSAAMAAMFYIIGLYFYLKARLADLRMTKILLYVACLLSYMFALASKENSATLPIALILVEIIFFQDFRQTMAHKRFLWIAVGAGICIVMFGTWVFLRGDLTIISKGYDRRYFSPMQRLMTEPYILLFYLTQIFYPTPSRLSIEHDFVVSTSLFHPWTTLPSMLIIVLLVVLAFYQIRKSPLLSFAILFFFLNHLIESSIIGLELSFEHRNYLPSLFLFLPVSAAFKKIIDHYDRRKPLMRSILVSSMILMLICFGTGTYIRNMTWANEKTLWEDAIRKAPGMGRPYHNLAWAYYQPTGQYDKALALYNKAFHMKKHHNLGKSLALNNLASVYYLKGNLNKATELWSEAVRFSPKHELFQFRLAKALTETGHLDRALTFLDQALSLKPNYIEALNLKGLILLKQKHYQEALPYFQKSLKLKPDLNPIMFNLGRNFRLMGRLDRANLYFKKAQFSHPTDIQNMLWLIENHLAANENREAASGIEQLFAVCDVKTLLAALELLRKENLMPGPSQAILRHGLASKLKKNSETISQFQDRSNQSPPSLNAYVEEQFSRKNF